MNPILTPQNRPQTLPEDAPRFDAALPGGGQGVKTSAAWLIDHAGFHKGLQNQRKCSQRGLSTHAYAGIDQPRRSHQLQISPELAKTVQDGVEAAFGIRLVPEPVVIGMNLK